MGDFATSKAVTGDLQNVVSAPNKTEKSSVNPRWGHLSDILCSKYTWISFFAIVVMASGVFGVPSKVLEKLDITLAQPGWLDAGVSVAGLGILLGSEVYAAKAKNREIAKKLMVANDEDLSQIKADYKLTDTELLVLWESEYKKLQSNLSWEDKLKVRATLYSIEKAIDVNNLDLLKNIHADYFTSENLDLAKNYQTLAKVFFTNLEDLNPKSFNTNELEDLITRLKEDLSTTSLSDDEFIIKNALIYRLFILLPQESVDRLLAKGIKFEPDNKIAMETYLEKTLGFTPSPDKIKKSQAEKELFLVEQMIEDIKKNVNKNDPLAIFIILDRSNRIIKLLQTTEHETNKVNINEKLENLNPIIVQALKNTSEENAVIGDILGAESQLTSIDPKALFPFAKYYANALVVMRSSDNFFEKESKDYAFCNEARETLTHLKEKQKAIYQYFEKDYAMSRIIKPFITEFDLSSTQEK